MKINIFSLILCFSFITIFGCKHNTSSSNEPKPHWKTFSKSNITGLVNDNIHAIYTSGSGQVWFGSDSGAFYYDSGTWRIIPSDSFIYYTYGQGPPMLHKRVSAIAEGIDGSIWFGLDGGGIRRFNKNSSILDNIWQRYTTSNNIITGIAAFKDKPGDIWISTKDGIYKYTFLDLNDPTNGNFDRVTTANLPSSLVNSVSVNEKNKWVFFGTNGGITFYDNDHTSWNTFIFPSKSPINSIAVQFTSNIIWCGTELNVVYYAPGPSEFIEYTPSNTNGILPDGGVNVVITDFFYTTRWFGTKAGLVQMKNQEWKIFTKDNTPELPSNTIQALYYDYLRKNLWIGTDMGIAVYNENGVHL